ncbi:MAG: hypothetical protein FIB05_15875 [Betaproteobacteria bacterium]|nr:hypothetical protein [Betaproteobacteria bacterium]
MSLALPIAASRHAMATRAPRPAASPATLAQSAPAALRDLRAARGRDFRRALDRFLDALEHPESAGRIDASLQLDAEPFVEDHFANQSGSILANEIVWSGEDQAFADWAIRARERWAAAASEFASLEIAAFGAASPVAPRLVAMALASLGDGLRWGAIAGRRTVGLRALHQAYRLAESAGFARSPVAVFLDGEAASATAETLYLRALLFEALCAGALSRQEMVIADGWLLLWSRDFRILAQPPEGHCPVTIGIHGDGGLEPCGGSGGGTLRYLGGLSGLRGRITDVRKAFHQGRMVAGSRRAASLAVEHHVCALSRLEELLAFWTNPAAAREKRSPALAGASIPLHVGLGDILARGFGPAVDGESGADACAPVAAAQAASGREDRTASYGMVLDPLGMRATVIDASARGLGLFVPRGDDAPVVGDLVGARVDGALKVGRVVRRFADPDTGRLRVGVSLLASDPARVELANAEPGVARSLARAHALFVPGADPDGAQDALLVPRAVFDAGATWKMRLDTTTYAIRLVRDHVSGRGWVAARFEASIAT